MWKLLSMLLVSALAVNGLPISQYAPTSEVIPTLATELLPPRIDAENTNFSVDVFDENTTLARELLPPAEDIKEKFGVVYVINIYSIQNNSGKDADEVLNTELTGKVPAILEPLATVLLILEDDDEATPVSLDEFAKDLEDDGFKIEKIEKDGETRVIKVDMDDSKDPDVELIELGKLNKIRRRRSPEPHGHLLKNLLSKHSGEESCDVCRGGRGGDGGYQNVGAAIGVIPIYIVPVSNGGYQHPPPQHYQPPPPQYYQPPPQQHYPQPPPQQNYPQPPHQNYPNQCNVCGGNHGGNHGSYSQSSAQASAQSSSDSY